MYKCLLILPSFLYFDQGRRSCPRASCIMILEIELKTAQLTRHGVPESRGSKAFDLNILGDGKEYERVLHFQIAKRREFIMQFA